MYNIEYYHNNKGILVDWLVKIEIIITSDNNKHKE